MPEVDYHLLKRAMLNGEDECGDTGIIKEYDDECFFALIDALGHGKEAYGVAVLAEDFLSENYRLDLVEMMQGLHSHLKGTRGAVAALCRLNLKSGVLHYVGVGNITVRLFGSHPYRFVPRDGIIGYMMTTPKEETIRLYPGDILLLSSDGIREHFNLSDFPELLTGSAVKIGTDVLGNLGKENDDASCIVLRYER